MASPPPREILQQFLPLLQQMEASRANKANEKLTKSRNAILALDALSVAKQRTLEAERARITNKALNLEIQVEEDRIKTQKRIDELLMERAARASKLTGERAKALGGAGAAVVDTLELDRRELSNLLATSGADTRVLLTPPQRRAEAIQDAGLTLTAPQRTEAAIAREGIGVDKSRVDVSRDALRANIAVSFADQFPDAPPAVIEQILQGDFSGFDQLGDSKSKQAFLAEAQQQITARFGIESANWRIIKNIESQLNITAINATNSRQIAQVRAMVDSYSAFASSIEGLASAVDKMEGAGQGEILKTLGQLTFKAANGMSQIMSAMTGQENVPLDPGTTNPLFDFSGESTSLVPSASSQAGLPLGGPAPITPESVTQDVIDAGGINNLGSVPINVPTEAAREAASPVPKPPVGYSVLFNATDRKHGFPSGTMKHLTFAESAFNPKNKSSKGAVGLTQLMPGTAKDLGVTDREDPVQSIEAGGQYLFEQTQRFDSLELGLAAFNWGPANVQKHLDGGGTLSTMPQDVQDYVTTIIGGVTIESNAGGPALSLTAPPPVDQQGGPPVLDPRSVSSPLDVVPPDAGLFSEPFRNPDAPRAAPTGIEAALQGIGTRINRAFK